MKKNLPREWKSSQPHVNRKLARDKNHSKAQIGRKRGGGGLQRVFPPSEEEIPSKQSLLSRKKPLKTPFYTTGVQSWLTIVRGAVNAARFTGHATPGWHCSSSARCVTCKKKKKQFFSQSS